MSRLVVISDLHAHPWTAFAKGGQGFTNSRFQNNLRVLRESLNQADKEDIPWVFAGDIVHTAGYAYNSVIHGLISTLIQFPNTRKFAVWGNHDARGIGRKITYIETVWTAIVEAIPNFVLLEDGHTYDAGTFTIAGAGYQPHSKYLHLGEGADVGVFHQTLKGTLTAAGYALPEGLDTASFLDKFRLTIAGHIHHPQDLEAPAGQGILIPGSPEHHDFGDKGEHGWWVIDLKGPEIDAKFIDGRSPQFLTVDFPEEITDDKNFYRVRGAVPKGVLPENAKFVAPEPTVIESRELLKGARETEQILQVWMKLNPPEGDAQDYLSTGRRLLAQKNPTRLRDVRLESVELENFCSYEKAHLRIEEGLWLVTGEGKDYPSNGAGKSTLFEAIYWCITGKNTKDLAADEVIRDATAGGPAQEARVSLVLEEKDGVLFIERRKSKTTSTLLVRPEHESDWEAKSVNEMTDKLCQYLGLTPEIFRNLAYFSQEKVLLFSSATDGERKNVLADLVGLSAYQEASSTAGADASTVHQMHDKQKSKKAALEEQVEKERERQNQTFLTFNTWKVEQEQRITFWEQRLVATEADTSPQLLVDRLAKIDNRITQLKQQKLAKLSTTQPLKEEQIFKQSLTFVRNEQDKAAELVSKLEQQLDCSEQEARERIKTLPAIYEAFERVVKEAELIAKEREALEPKVEDARALFEATHTIHRELYQQFVTAEKRLNSGTCYACQQVITADHAKICLQPLQEKLTSIVTKKGLVSSQRVVLEDQMEAIEKRAQEIAEEGRLIVAQRHHVEELKSLLERLEKARVDLTKENLVRHHLKKKAEEQALQQTQQTWSAYIARVAKLRSRAARYVENETRRVDIELRECQEKLNAVREQQNPYSESLKLSVVRVDNLLADISEIDENINELVAEIQIYEYWKKGFSKQGIQSLLLEEIAILFNKKRSSIIPVLTGGVYDVQFSVLSRTKAGELREKTEFLLWKHGIPVPYASTSGGQRRRIDLCIMLTLASAVTEWMGVKGILGFMVLDEVFGFLDSAGSEGLYSALQEVQKQIPTIFSVTHDDHLQALFPQRIHIRQDERGISSISN